MIDVNLPLELDDGTPVELVEVIGKYSMRVRLPADKSRYIDGRRAHGGVWNYDRLDGHFIGDTNRRSHFGIRNGFAGPDEIEEMFS